MDNLGINVDNCGLYVHVPFCDSRCWYCDFYLETGWSPEVLKKYVDRVHEEWEDRKGLFDRFVFTSLYFGGGTPSVLPAEVFGKLIGGLKPPGGSWRDIELEANPETLDQSRLEAWSQGGVTRLSLGIQSLQAPLLKTLGRGAQPEQVVGALSLMQKYWRGSWSADFITGIPGQTPDILSEDLERVLEYAPGHVSLYSLSIENKTALNSLKQRGKFAPLGEDAHALLFETGAELLMKRGYEAYEVSNFALPGERSRHNLLYWQGRPYLGLGPGAHSTLPNGEGAIRSVNPHLFAWLSKGAIIREKELLSPQTLAYERLMTGLRTSEGVTFEHLGPPGVWKGPEQGDQFWYDRAQEGWFDLDLLPNQLVVPWSRRQVLHPLLVKILERTDLDSVSKAKELDLKEQS